MAKNSSKINSQESFKNFETDNVEDKVLFKGTNITIGDITIPVSPIKHDKNDWATIKGESYSPDRAEFILDKFKQDFPEHGEVEYDRLMATISRSKPLSRWLAQTNVDYSISAQVPEYFKEFVEPNEFNRSSKVITEYNKILAEESQETQRLAAEYQRRMAEINNKYEKEKQKFIKDPLVRILTMQSNELPITLQLAIENFTPEANEGAPEKRRYAREMVINYKVALLKILKEKPDINIDEVITRLSVK